MVASHDVRGAVRARLGAMVDALGVDPDRARDSAVYRALVEAPWQLEEVDRAGRVPRRRDRERLTIMVAVAKAVQD